MKKNISIAIFLFSCYILCSFFGNIAIIDMTNKLNSEEKKVLIDMGFEETIWDHLSVLFAIILGFGLFLLIVIMYFQSRDNYTILVKCSRCKNTFFTNESNVECPYCNHRGVLYI